MIRGMSEPPGANQPVRLPCGAWPSPLDTESLASAALRLGHPAFASDGSLLWVEGRPSDSGRSVLVRSPATDRGDVDSPSDLTPAPLDVRSRVHEYGGGAYAVLGDQIVFVDARTSWLYRVRIGEATPHVLSAPGGDWRFGDLTADPAHGRVLAVAERHSPAGGMPENLLVGIDQGTGAIEALASGASFYSSPAPSPDGKRLAWISWMHPHLPWDAGALHVAELDAAGRPEQIRHVAGDATGSCQQPRFARDGTLYFLLESQATNQHWNLHRWRDGASELVAPQPTSELGLPPWQLGTRTWDFLDENTVIAATVTDGLTALCEIDLRSGRATALPIAVASVGHLAAHAGRVVLSAGLASETSGIFVFERARGSITRLQRLRASLPLALGAGYVSVAEPITFATSAGDRAHGFFYPPTNPKAEPRAGERPPLVVVVHGGPTAAATPAFSPLVQFWTTRGLAVLDVNYRGSTGYGRAFRDRLRGQWGIFDVDDCIAGARALVEAGKVDPQRVAIRGSSAGGFTVLAALTCPDSGFHAGVSLYGVSDLAALAQDTHKFESHYLDALVGPWPARADLYAERSPINHGDRVRCPILFFQGLDDKVVPPDQTERFAQILREKNLAVEVHTFAGEQHGFRRAATLRTVYTAELDFYGRRFGFVPA
jgi:dipeptidyl aminopeptidase/acylaminoacyl peptidase